MRPSSHEPTVFFRTVRPATVGVGGGILLMVVLGLFGFLVSTSSRPARAEAPHGVSPAAASDVITATLRFDQDLYPVNLGGTFTADLLVDNASGLDGWDGVLVYDPALIEVMQVTLGGFLSSSGRTVESLERDLGPGRLAIGAYSYGAPPAVAGSGVLVHLTLRALATGQTTVALEGALLASIDGFGGVQSQPVVMRGATVGITFPLAVTLAEFQAVAQPVGLRVSWETTSEIDNRGFNLWRSQTSTKPVTRLAFVPSQAPGSGQGFVYEWLDTDVVVGTTYYYWLEAVAIGGGTTVYGPVSATFQAAAMVSVTGALLL